MNQKTMLRQIISENKKGETTIQLNGGEILNRCIETMRGFETDAGIIHWDDVACIWDYHAPTDQVMSIPLN
jgi:hypothetical protein